MNLFPWRSRVTLSLTFFISWHKAGSRLVTYGHVSNKIKKVSPFPIKRVLLRFIVTIILFCLTGLFNICDKVLISLDIMLEFREYFKRGHPLGNVIMSKLSVLRMKCREVCLRLWFMFFNVCWKRFHNDRVSSKLILPEHVAISQKSY